MRIQKTLLVLWCVLVVGLGAAEREKLTFRQAMVTYGQGLLKPLPRVMDWLDNRHFLEMKGPQLLAVNARSGASRVFFAGPDHAELVKHGLSFRDIRDWTPDHTTLCFLKDDRVFVYRLSDRRLFAPRLGAGVHTPRLSPNGRFVAFTRSNDLFVYRLDTQETRRLTTDGSDVILNGYATWVYYEEILGRGSRYCAFWWGPHSRRIAFFRFDQSRVPVFNLTPADPVYPELERQYYPKAGAPNPEVRLGVADVQSGALNWIDVPGRKEHYLAHPRWSSDGEALFFQWMNRGQDHLKVLSWRKPGAEAREVYSQTRSTWVEFLEKNDLSLLRNGGMVVRAARGDWYHLFFVSPQGRVRPLTSGNWSVQSILQVNEKRGEVLFSASPGDSTQSRAYRIPLAGGEPRCLTPETGWHSVNPSPDGSLLLDRHSSLDRPGCLDLRDRRGKKLRRLGNSNSPAVAKYGLDRMRLVRVPAGDGVMLPVLLLVPPDFDPAVAYPVVLNIYGGPGAMSVRNVFPGRRGMGAFYLAQMGIVVAVADHRGAGHQGRAGMDLMYRRLGYWEMHDYTKVVEYLKSKPWVDGSRIGISGGSYGGYVSALALTSAPGVFACGIASFPVTDWKLYDSVYTERYMDTPRENPEGYRSASALSHVDTYRGGLRLVHGTMDDNVHMQNSLQLLDRLQEAGKEVEFMAFPGERHGFRGVKRVFDARCSLDFWSRRFFNHPWSGKP